MRIPKLKSPAGGTLSSVRAAVRGGADEVYVGVGTGLAPLGRTTLFTPTLGLRPQGYCYPVPKVLRALEYCRKHDVELQVTMNNHYSAPMLDIARRIAAEL